MREQIVPGIRVKSSIAKRIRQEAKKVRGHEVLERRFMGRFWKVPMLGQESGSFIIFREASRRDLNPDEPIIYEHRTDFGNHNDETARASCDLYDSLVEEFQFDPRLKINFYERNREAVFDNLESDMLLDDDSLFDDLDDLGTDDDLWSDLEDEDPYQGLFDF